MKKKNETNACNALIEIHARVECAKYECESCPDDEACEGKEVDFILKSTCIGKLRVAVEHTVIPLFKGQHSYAISSYKRAEEITRLCRGKIPADRYYYLTFPHALVGSLKDIKQRKDFDEKLALWIIQEAPELRVDEAPRQFSHEVNIVLLTCGGTHPDWNGRVGRIPEYPTDAVILQKESFDSAIQHGLDKLPKYKANGIEGFKTVLLLEDVAGLQQERITEQLTSSEMTRIGESIDYIVVLKSDNESQMIVGYVWKENETWHRVIPANRRFSFRSGS